MLREKIYKNIIAYSFLKFYIKFTKNDNSYGMLIEVGIFPALLVILLMNILENT